jgi:hypothetical protein
MDTFKHYPRDFLYNMRRDLMEMPPQLLRPQASLIVKSEAIRKEEDEREAHLDEELGQWTKEYLQQVWLSFSFIFRSYVLFLWLSFSFSGLAGNATRWHEQECRRDCTSPAPGDATTATTTTTTAAATTAQRSPPERLGRSRIQQGVARDECTE